MSSFGLLVGPTPLPRLHVYVDETGDRGFSKKASPFFAMTALMVPEEDGGDVRFTAGGLRALIGTEKPLHWVDHFKSKHPERRLMAAEKLALMRSVRVIHVIVPKAAVAADAGITRNAYFYNYTTRWLLERVAYAAQGWQGGPRLAIVRLGHVRGMDHGSTADYLDRVRRGKCGGFGSVPWHHIKWPPTWHGTEWDGIQLADIHAGLLGTALNGDPSDRRCAHGLLLCKQQLHRRPDGEALGWGVKVYGETSFVEGRVWWKEWNTL